MENGELTYERDLLKRPTYPGGSARKPWEFLSSVEKSSWASSPAATFCYMTAVGNTFLFHFTT